MGDRLVRVERFEELATGMRIVLVGCEWAGCRDTHGGICGGQVLGYTRAPDGRLELEPIRDVSGSNCQGRSICVTADDVEQNKAFRFASDLGIADQLAREENPYLSRTVVGTAGVDETRTLTKERP